TEEDGRSGSGGQGAVVVRARRRKAACPRAGCGREGQAAGKHAIRRGARRVRLADLLCRQGDVFRQGAAARSRGNGFGEIVTTVIASEAKQSSFAARKLDCFVASLLAMTTEGTQNAKAQRHLRRDRRRRLYRRRDRQEIR